MPPKKFSQSDFHDYDAFALHLQQHPCIWDPHNENYNLAEYRNTAYGKIERALKLKSGEAKTIYVYARANYRNGFCRLMKGNELSKCDKKSLQLYNYLWDVMEENIQGANKTTKQSWVPSSPELLQKLCFRAMTMFKVVLTILNILNKKSVTPGKIDIGTNTESSDPETDGGINTASVPDDVLEVSEKIDEHESLDSRNHVVVVMGFHLVGTRENSMVMHTGFSSPAVKEQALCGLIFNPILDDILCFLKQNKIDTPKMSTMNTNYLLEKVVNPLGPGYETDDDNTFEEGSFAEKNVTGLRISSPQSDFTESLPDLPDPLDMDMMIDGNDLSFFDSLSNDTYFRIPWPLITSSVKDMCGLQSNDRVMHVIFDLNTINKNNLNSVKVDINFNKGGKRQLEDMGETDNFKKFKTVAKN